MWTNFITLLKALAIGSCIIGMVLAGYILAPFIIVIIVYITISSYNEYKNRNE